MPPKRSPAHYLWAALIARIYEVFPLICPICAGQMRIIAFITEQAYKRQPDNPAVADTLGWILIERGDLKRGLELVRKALAKAPEAAEMRYHLAVGLERVGDKAQARTELQALIRSGRSFPKLEEAKALLERL